jgi:polysaccharide biosynthesis protein PslH
MVFPPTDGGAISMANITKYMAMRGHEMVVATFAKPGETVPDDARSFCTCHPVYASTSHSVMKIIHSYRTGTPYIIEKYQSDAMASLLDDLVRKERFDCIHVDYLMMAPYAVALKKKYGIPIMLRQHDFETTMLERFAESEQNNFLRIFIRSEYHRMKRYEPAICAEFDLCTMITSKDESRLRALTDAVNVMTIPAGMELPEIVPAPVKNTIFFISTLTWKPNIDGFFWFYKEVLPLINARVPDVRVVVAGKGNSPEFSSLKDPQVEMVGFVEDVAPWYAQAEVGIVPLFAGSGMRIKLLEMMAFGKPVVATPIGAEGIHVDDGENVFIAEDRVSFAERIIELLNSAELRQRIGANARRRVQTEYSWESVAEQFETAYLPIINRVRS